MVVFLLVIGVTAITLQMTVHGVWKRTLREQIERNLKQKTLMFAYRVEADRQHSLADITAQEGQAAGARATVIDPTGKVLADSEADPSTMENHAHRREFVSALAGEVGVDERKSQTLSIPFLYVAAPVSGGAVRLAYPLNEIEITDRPRGGPPSRSGASGRNGAPLRPVGCHAGQPTPAIGLLQPATQRRTWPASGRIYTTAIPVRRLFPGAPRQPQRRSRRASG